jgi:hypothetical protein
MLFVMLNTIVVEVCLLLGVVFLSQMTAVIPENVASTSCVNRFSQQTLLTVNRKHFFMNILA